MILLVKDATLLDHLIDIIPDSKYDVDTNHILVQISITIRQMQDSYTKLVNNYNKYISVETKQGRLHFEKSLRRIRRSCKNLHNVGTRKIQVYKDR